MIWVLAPAGLVPVAANLPARVSERSPSGNPIITRRTGPPHSDLCARALRTGGRAYFNAYRLIADPPLLLAVSLSEKQMLAAWRVHAVVAAAIVAGFGILLCLPGA